MQGEEEDLDAIIPTMGLTSDSGEDPSKSEMTDNPMTDIFYGVPNMTVDPTPDANIFHDPMPDKNNAFHAMHLDTINVDGLYYFDPSNLDQEVTGFVECAFHLMLDPNDIIDSHNVDKFLFMLDYDELWEAHKEFGSFAYGSHAATQD